MNRLTRTNGRRSSQTFELHSSFTPKGDQPQAIEELCQGVNENRPYQTLLGVTGSGKTFTIANVIARTNRPTLVISHNKTLAAQLYGELKAFFPENAVEFFISYYDYYQPEAYLPTTDTYIEKDTSINDDIDRLRLRATASLLERNDVIIVASVSCIYGLGSPDEYKRQFVFIEKDAEADRDDLIRALISIHYNRNDISFTRGNFRVRGDTIELIPAYHENALRIEFFGDTIERITEIDPLTGEIIRERHRAAVYPAKHFITSQPQLEKAIADIRIELKSTVEDFVSQNRLLEAQRIEMRTRYDLEMLKEVGYCSGIENYSRHLTGRKPGERPFTLIDFFPEDFLTIIDESHQSIPQVRAMYAGDRSRKETLVAHGFRLPSALDNRPLFFEEFEALTGPTIFVSATPADYELQKCEGVVVDQVIRPTGLLDPAITVKPLSTQVDDLLKQVRLRRSRNERVLVTTLTKRMSEDLTDYMKKMDIRVRYLHSEIDAIDRTEIIRDLRLAEFDVLVGVNLLREGLDLPEVSLVAILDADKQGFLRSKTALIQTMGRAARNVEGKVILYADEQSQAMSQALSEVGRRRQVQLEYNRRHGITPRSIKKPIRDRLVEKREDEEIDEEGLTPGEAKKLVKKLDRQMREYAKILDFEKAAQVRDRITSLKTKFDL
jgi:excinuclease ABC subunit B